MNTSTTTSDRSGIPVVLDAWSPAIERRLCRATKSNGQMTEAAIRERARQFGIVDAATGNVFELKHDVEVMEKADRLGAEVVADLENKFAAITERHGSEVAELALDIVNTYIQSA